MWIKRSPQRGTGDSTLAVPFGQPSARASTPTTPTQFRRCSAPTIAFLYYLHTCLLVVLGVSSVDALVPVAGPGHPVRNSHEKLSKRNGGRSSCEASQMGPDPVGPQLSRPLLELITPDGCASSSPSDQSALIANIQEAVAGGVSLVQLRDYKSSAERKAELAARIVVAMERRAMFVVNGEPEAARASGADGVHLPERMIDCLVGLRGEGREGWPRLVGCSVHSVPVAVEAARLGADYVQVGTMFATQSHPGKVPEGVGMLNNVRRQLQAEGFVDVLVIGVGGIEASNCGKVVEAGGDGVAAIRCLCLSSDAEGEARHIMGELKRGGSTDSGCGVVVGDKR